jgi:hypothetical protein
VCTEHCCMHHFKRAGKRRPLDCACSGPIRQHSKYYPRLPQIWKDSVLLANLIHITNQIVNSSLRDDLRRHMADASLYILPALSNFDIRNTPRQLQDDFPSSWTEIAQNIQMEPHNHVLPGFAAACNFSTAP